MALLQLRRCFVLLTLLPLCLSTFAGFVDFADFFHPAEIQSENGRFKARVVSVVFLSDLDQTGARHRLQSVSEDGSILWERDYAYDVNTTATLSNDGRYLVHIRLFHGLETSGSKAPLVVYHAEGEHRFTAKELQLSVAEDPKVIPLGTERLTGKAHFEYQETDAVKLVVDTLQGRRCIRLRPEISVELSCAGK